MAKKFQNLTVDYGTIIGKMPIGDRVNMARSGEGRQLLSSLTPTQLADMFPDYYKKAYPDVGKILKSISSPSFKPLSREEADIQMGKNEAFIRSKERLSQPDMKPAWFRKLQEETGQKLSDAGAKAQLSGAKKDLLREMESSGVKSDDPRASFLKDLSDDDLKKAGITKQSDNQGNIVFRRTEITDEQAKARLESIDPKIEAIRKTILGKESSGRYDITSFAEGRGSNASGGYQFADGTWRAQARKAGYDPDLYPRAKMAPPEVQDAVARSYIKDILARNGGDVSAVPREWYAGPKGYLTDYELRVNRGLTLEKYVSDWMQKYQANSGGSVTQTQIAQSLEEAKKQIRQDQEGHLAGRVEMPVLPNGLKPEVVTFYNGLTDRQKQDFYSMLKAAGGGPSQDQLSAGVNRVNDLYDKNPTALQQGVFKGNGRLLFDNDRIAAGASQLSGHTQAALNKFQEFAPEGTTITSTYRSPEHHIEASKPGGPGAHSRGSAVDIRSSGKSPAELAQTIQALKRAGFTKVLLEGDHIHAEANPGQDFHISNLGRGNPGIDLESARTAADRVAWNEGLSAERETANVTPAPTSTPASTPRQAEELRPTAQAVSANRPQQQAQNTSNTEDKTSSLAATREYEAAKQAGKFDNQQKPEEVRVLAEGGQAEVNSDEIKAMPIDSLKGDNSVVMDQDNKPLFTMNTKDEKAVYDPKTKQVDVQPINKTDGDSLGSGKLLTESSHQTKGETHPDSPPQPVFREPMPTTAPRSGDVSVSITDDMFKDPGFKRAIAKTRFVDTGDAALGGHFGAANADLG